MPFDANPAEVRFNLAERRRPFSLMVSLLGGGGFFAIGLGSDGVREVEASLEFGAALSINLGVATNMPWVSMNVTFGIVMDIHFSSVQTSKRSERYSLRNARDGSIFVARQAGR